VCSPGRWAAVVAFVCAAPSARALAADCEVSRYSPADQGRDAAVLEAGTLAANGRYADARAVYLWVLARRRDDAEALFGLARVDAWGGCWAIAEREYREVISEHPADSDVRAGYVDLLVWSGRLDEAEQVLRDGLAVDPASPGLVARAARFAFWRGDATQAVRLADEAERAAPDDGDLRAMRDRMFVGEARATVHVDDYPSGYTSLYTISTQVLERRGRFEVYGGAQLVGGPAQDGRYPLGVAYHPALGMTVGAEVAPGAPSHAIPDWSFKTWMLSPLAGRFDAFLAYSLWHYSHENELVQILNPSIGVALPRELRADVRGWISAVTVPGDQAAAGQTRVEGAAGAQLTWSATPRLDAAVTYTYGAEADTYGAGGAGAILVYQFLEYRSHLATAFVDLLLGRGGGIRPLVGVEYRMPAAITIWSFEVSAYGRW